MCTRTFKVKEDKALEGPAPFLFRCVNEQTWVESLPGTAEFSMRPFSLGLALEMQGA